MPIRTVMTIYGSSPLARGLPRPRSLRSASAGIIPARAGFTPARTRKYSARQDHPRSRGVYGTSISMAWVAMGSSPLARGLRGGGHGTAPPHHGSSPLARGLPAERPARAHVGRIIPARAGFTWRSRPSLPTTGDHPRSRGVYVGGQPGRQSLSRIIPARAGFTGGDPHRGGRRGDHPRSRGVYPGRGSGRGSSRGSSPLARGLPSQGHRGLRQRWIIPARAGFTPRARRSSRSSPDHPRSRGVYAEPTGWDPAPWGSSPLARGLHRDRPRHEVIGGIIPARAGFTAVCSHAAAASKDHPRSRGVYRPAMSDHTPPRGSSPLARGLRWVPASWSHARGIIPARAGFTRRHALPQVGDRDHPRSRGVYPPQCARQRSRPGSSPLARGLRGMGMMVGPAGRIIPARAGFTSALAKADTNSEDHPRSRGVYPSCDWGLPVGPGSSPLARGLPRDRQPHGHRPGIIPARAGFTAGLPRWG